MPVFSARVRVKNSYLEFVRVGDAGDDVPALSSEGTCRIYFDATTNKLLISVDGGAYAELVPSEI